MKRIHLFFLLVLIVAASCKKKNPAEELPPADSFMPMQIGNIWKMADHTYTEIQGTEMIDHKLYYKFYSKVGNDVINVQYLRLDKNNQLLESYPNDPKAVYTHAKFNANLNDVFYTIGDKSVNDSKVKLVEKTATQRTFEFDPVYGKGNPYRVSYVKGIGLDQDWKIIEINGQKIR